MWSERCAMQDDPLSHAIKITIEANTRTGKLLSEFIRDEIPDMTLLIENVHEQISTSMSSRCLI